MIEPPRQWTKTRCYTLGRSVQNYDPEKNICYFTEYSKGNVLEGRVIIKNCNPLLPGSRSIVIDNSAQQKDEEKGLDLNPFNKP